MKKIAVHSLLLLIILGSGRLQAVAGPADKIRKNIECYFNDYLRGETPLYEKHQSFSLLKVSAYRQLVWEAWKTANDELDEEKLIALDTLSASSKGKWHLPKELEPNAIMPYYWGSKGAEKPADGYPMYLYIHGSGPKQAEWKTGLNICSRFDDAPSVYFIPQIPNEGGYYRWWQKAKQYAWEKLFRQALVSGHVNPDKLFIFGISEGGYGSQRLASFYADYLRTFEERPCRKLCSHRLLPADRCRRPRLLPEHPHRLREGGI